MKYYSNILCVMLSGAALAAMFSACTFEQEDYFDESAAIRIQHVNDEIQKTLSAPSSENGWVIQYFVAGTDELTFEGFNLFGKFYENGKVTLSSDHRYLRNGNAGKYTEYTSYYEMLAEEGPVLCFNTWNDILSVFVDPVDPSAAPGSLVDDGEGMNGDDRLVVLSYSPDEILMRGERHSAPIRFVKSDLSPEAYIDKTTVAKMEFAGGKIDEYRLSNGSDTRFISGISNGYFDYVDRLDDPLDKSVKSCVFTPNGFRTRDSFVLGNDTVQEFVLDLEKERLVCGNVEMLPCWERLVTKQISANGAVSITTDGACESFATLYNKLASDIQAVFPSQILNYITFGKSSESGSKSRVGLVFYVTTTRSKFLTGFTGTVTFDEDNATATISIDPNDPSDNFGNYSKKDIGASFTDIVNALNGTYTIEVNSKFRPSMATWTKVNDPSFYFVTNF